MKRYELIATASESGQLKITANNEGFNALELAGILGVKYDDILKQIHGVEHAEVEFKRTVVKEAE